MNFQKVVTQHRAVSFFVTAVSKLLMRLIGPAGKFTSPLHCQALYAFSLFAIALLLSWLFNPLLSQVKQLSAYMAALGLSALGLVLGVYVLHGLGKAGVWLAVFFSLILVTFTYITTYYVLEPGPSFIGAIAETTTEEASAYISIGAILTIASAVCGYVLFVHKTRRFFAYANIFIAIFFIVHCVFAQSRMLTRDAPKEMRMAARWSMDYIFDPLKYTMDYLFGKQGKVKVDALRNLSDPAALPASLQWQEPLVIIFFVGESLRADHLEINGYGRDTTPRLAKERLVNFPHTLSGAAWTRESVICIFSDRLPDARESRYGSFVKIFQKLGYTITTYNANTRPNNSDFSTAILTEGAKRFYSSRPDMSMIEQLAKEVGKNAKSELHILSPYGSHFSYLDGYARSDAFFQPDIYTKPLTMEQLPSIINSYDNTVRYTDKIICSAIDLVRDKNAVVVYVSDHGESLGEEERFFHGINSAPEQRMVPFFFWFSDKYRAMHPEIITNLMKRTHENVNHSNIFHSILGIAGIKSPVHDPMRDLTQEAITQSYSMPLPGVTK